MDPVSPSNVARLAAYVAVAGVVFWSCTGSGDTRTVPDYAGSPLGRIAFGSCNDQDLPQPMWSAVLERQPDLWIWMGDNISADTDDPAIMHSRYERQLQHPEYRRIVGSVPIIGTWDDHDYGRNNVGREYPTRQASQQLFLDFIGEPKDSPRRSRSGVFASYVYGPATQSVRVILLDMRYHRETPGPNADPLGAEQWAWLARELRESTSQITLLGTSVQLLADEYRGEGWTNFETARLRLYGLIRDSGIGGLIVISGDRHIGEIAVSDSSLVGYPIYEVTSSGLTHTWDQEIDVPNRYRRGDLVIALNFAEIEIEWNADPVTITMRIRDVANTVRSEVQTTLRALQPNN